MQGTEPQAGKAQGLRASARGHGPESTPRTQDQELCPLDSSCPGKDHGMVWSPGASVHVFYDHPDSTSVSCPDHLISAARRKDWVTSNGPAAGAPAQRVFPPANESEPCTGRAAGPLKPEHLKHTLPDGYHTRCPHQLEADGPQC